MNVNGQITPGPMPLGVDQFRALSIVTRRALYDRFGIVDEIPLDLCPAPIRWGQLRGQLRARANQI
jgi:hypothetical protein